MMWLIYFIDILEKISTFFGLIGVIILSCLALFILFYAVYCDDRYDNNKKFSNIKNYKKNMIFYIIISGLFLLISNIIPSQKTAYMMAGVYFGEKIVKSDKASNLANKTYSLIEKHLDSGIENISKELEKKVIEKIK